MPRIRRIVRPGAHAYLLDSPEERTNYLDRAGKPFLRTGWVALSFALMSTHTHFAAIAGLDPFDRWSRPLHSGLITWLNRRRSSLGAGIANRPSTREVPLDAAGQLIAYHHNNPVQAGVVTSASDSD